MTSAYIAPARETLTFMRWADLEGIESYEREVVWKREIRARNICRTSGSPIQALSAFPAGQGFMEAVSSATHIAALAASTQPSTASREICVIAEAWDIPSLETADGMEPIPKQWFLEEPRAHAAWLLACARGRRVISPARRLEPRIAQASVVWNSQRSVDENQLALAEFTAVAGSAGPSRRPERPVHAH